MTTVVIFYLLKIKIYQIRHQTCEGAARTCIQFFFLQVYNTSISFFFTGVQYSDCFFFLQVYNTPIADVFLNVLQTLLQIEPDNPLRQAGKVWLTSAGWLVFYREIMVKQDTAQRKITVNLIAIDPLSRHQKSTESSVMAFGL